MKKSRALILPALFMLIFSANASAEDLSHIPGAFVDIGYGARPMGMGGAFVGLADDRNAVMGNPAGLLKTSGSGVSFMWAKQLGLIPYNYLCYSRSLGGSYRIGGGLIYSGDDLLSETTALISFASPMDKLHPLLKNTAIAANVKIRSASFGNNTDGDEDRVTGDAFGYGLDLAFMWFAAPKMSVGLLFRDLYNDVNWNSSVSGSYSENVPLEMTLGTSYRFSTITVASVDLRKSLYQDVENRLMAGFEQKVFQFIALRAGWGRNIGAKYANQEIAMGLGVEKAMKAFYFRFDFAYLLNDLKNTPRAGVSIDW